MLKNKFLIFLIASVVAVFALSSCEENSTGPVDDDKPVPSPASNLEATSFDDSSIMIRFDMSPSETNDLFQNYTVTWKEADSPSAADEVSLPAGEHETLISGLQEGTIYEFTVVAKYTNGEVSSAVSVKWSPATRFTETVNDAPIRIYESSSDFGSGLQMFFEAEGGPRARKVSNGDEWDLGLYTRDNSLVIGSATKLTYNYAQTPEPTFMFHDYFLAQSLDAVFDSQAMNEGARNDSYMEMTYDLAQVTGNDNVVFYVRKYQPGQTRYNYAKVMVKRPAGGGSFLQGTSPNRYVELEISYQKVADVPYAKTAKN